MTTLETLLTDHDMASVWNIDPDRVVVTALDPTEGKSADLRVDFTIEGVTAPLPLPVSITALDAGSIQISGETKVDRAQFNLGWNKLGMMGTAGTAAAEAVFVRASQ